MGGNLASILMYLFILNYYLSKLHITCLKIKLYLKGNNDQWHIHLHNQPVTLLSRGSHFQPILLADDLGIDLLGSK